MTDKWQDVSCKNCGKKLTDPASSHLFHDIQTGGLLSLGGIHKICPTAQTVSLVEMTTAHLALILTTARILRANLQNMTPPGMDAYLADDLAALNEALAPFDPQPSSGAADAAPVHTLKLVEKETT